MRLTRRRAESMPMRDTASRTTRRTSPEGLRLGERLRQLRVAAGWTQTELAGDRFSKEYVSQIERGKTRPTQGTIEWLAERLGADPGFLASGVSTDERSRVEAVLARAEALSGAHRYPEAIEVFSDAYAAVLATGSPGLDVRALTGHAWARLQHGNLREALELLTRARGLTEDTSFTDLDRADVLFKLGVCRYKLSSISSSLGLLN